MTRFYRPAPRRIVIRKSDGALALCADNNGLIGWIQWRDIKTINGQYYI